MENRALRIWGRVRNVLGITLLVLLFLLPLLWVMLGFIILCILDHIITSECTRNDHEATLGKYGGLPQDAIVEPLGTLFSNGVLKNVQRHILTTIESNQNMIVNFSIPEAYMNGKLIGVYIHKDEAYMSEITLKQWLIYVMATNKELQIQWIDDVTTLNPAYSNVRDKRGIRVKFPAAESSVILFKEEMGELYPSYVSDSGAAIVDLSAHPNLKANTMNALTALTNMNAFRN